MVGVPAGGAGHMESRPNSRFLAATDRTYGIVGYIYGQQRVSSMVAVSQKRWAWAEAASAKHRTWYRNNGLFEHPQHSTHDLPASLPACNRTMPVDSDLVLVHGRARSRTCAYRYAAFFAHAHHQQKH